MDLKKELNLLDVFCISSGAMLSGLFILPGRAFDLAGPVILISYLLAGLLALTGLLSQAELASAMPKAGGTYFYVTRSMGSAVGTVYGLITWLSLVLKSAYELFFMATLILGFEAVNLPINKPILAVLLCALFLGLNMIGAKEAGRLQVYLVFGLLIILFYYCLRVIPFAEAHNFTPFIKPNQGFGSIITAAGFVFISFGGLLKVASVAEEVKNPGRVIPLGMIYSLVVICLVYLMVVFVTVAAKGTEISKESPITDLASSFPEGWATFIMGGAAILAVVTAANSGIMAASRYPLALARDKMLPDSLANINTRFKTPHNSLILTGVVIVAAIFVDVNILVKAASTVLIMTYMFTCVAVVILRESRVQNYRPAFKSPLYPWVQVVGFLGLSVLMFMIGLEAFLISCVLAVVGFIVYWYYGRSRASQEYALLHLIERITDRQLTDHGLETELKDILHERDEVLKDRFDHLIDICPVLDIEEVTSLEEFFNKAAEAIGEDINESPDELFQLFMEREKESSTVLNPFLAIPHIVIQGEKHFDILLARCKEGIAFSEEAPRVHTVFILIGTKDERPFHLQSLAAICQIVQHEDFEKQWMAAKKPEALRDIVLLGKRKRM